MEYGFVYNAIIMPSILFCLSLRSSDRSIMMPKEPVYKQTRKNIYTTLKNMDTTPHKDTGDNNLYTKLGLKKKKTKKKK